MSHHLRDVLRLSVGSQITAVSQASGIEYLALVSSSEKDRAVQLRILKKTEKSQHVPVVSTLACGLPKGSHADQICEQVSQLGPENLIFWEADRTIVKLKNADLKAERWQKIAESAARQSKQSRIPKVSYLHDSNKLFSWVDHHCNAVKDLLAVCSLHPDAKTMQAYAAVEGSVHIFVGPEGDFSPEEIRQFDNRSARHVSLGPLVLRVETAAVAAVAMGLATWGWRKI